MSTILRLARLVKPSSGSGIHLPADDSQRRLPCWQLAWRVGFVPCLSTAGLVALKEALLSDDPRLIQGATMEPPPLQVFADLPVRCGCALSFTGWQGDGLATVGAVDEYFGRLCYAAGVRLGDLTGARLFINWFDEQPREEMRRLLLAEVELALARRFAAAG